MTDYIYSIKAKNVNKIFKRKNLEVNALKDFNIKIKKGSIHGLLGALNLVSVGSAMVWYHHRDKFNISIHYKRSVKDYAHKQYDTHILNSSSIN